MKPLLNTLYVTSPDSYVRRDGTNIVVEVGGTEAGRLPIHNIQQMICFGHSGASPGAMELCSESGVTLTFLKPNGRFIASVHGETKGNVILRRRQYRIADSESGSVEIARNMIKAKLVNCRNLLNKGMSNHPDINSSGIITDAVRNINSCIDRTDDTGSVDELRGIEGVSAKWYFSALDSLILKNKGDFYMRVRTRRPPRDRFNSLLSFLYSLLVNDVKSSLEAVGLDPYVGFMHTDRPGRPSLALDLMEEMRPVADRMALRLINLAMLDSGSFCSDLDITYRLNDDSRALVIREWQNMKKKEIIHPFLNERIQMGLLPYIQSMLLSKTVRGELDGYPPFNMRLR